MKSKQYQLTIVRPGGNDTALVKGIVAKKLRKSINDAIMKLYPNVEQVGFYSFSPKTNTGRLEMAGGEFCGNATRSLAYLLLDGKPGTTTISVSGVRQPLKAGIKKKGTAFAQMPIKSDDNAIETLAEGIAKIQLEGITHLVVKKTKTTNKDLKKEAKALLKTWGLLSSIAAGVMFVSKEKRSLKIDPIVWVRDLETFFYETACASGTTAVGLWKTQTSKKDATIRVIQPSGKAIVASVTKRKGETTTVFIDGPVNVLEKEVVFL